MQESKTLILGIDPGFTGALALYDPGARNVIDVWDMPLKYGPGKAFDTRNEIDGQALAKIIHDLSSRLTLAVVERVHASPGAGVTSMFRFGEGYGMLLGVLISNDIRTITPVPSVWKCSMGLTHDKKESFAAVEQYVSNEARTKWCKRAKDHGRAEAILLACFGAKTAPCRSCRTPFPNNMA